MNDPKKTPAFPTNKSGVVAIHGLSQYAYVAAQFHAALICDGITTTAPQQQFSAKQAFDHADAFFAELTKRTS